jgi:predicted metal-dependent phosphoesterase TrpH
MYNTKMFPQSNAHIHLPPNFSAFMTVEEAIKQAASEDLKLLGASNYYDFSVYSKFSELAKTQNLFALFGIEVIALDLELQKASIKINDPGNPGRFYLCGKGISSFDALSPNAEAILRNIRESDVARMRAMTEALTQCFVQAGISVNLTITAICESIAKKSNCPLSTVYLQERHLAQAFQEALFAEIINEESRRAALTALCGAPINSIDPLSVQNALRSHLLKSQKPAYVAENFVDVEAAFALILELGGIPSYPTLLDGVGSGAFCGFEASPDALIANLAARNLHAAELIPTRNTPEVLEAYVLAMRSAGLVITAGTEHNTPEMQPLTPRCKNNQPIPEAVQQIFWEGACVAAAHQHLTQHQQLAKAGYVDHLGNRTEATIERLAMMGSELLG